MLKNILYLSIFTVFVVIVWVSLAIFDALTASTITQTVSTQITPLNPSFNTSILPNLAARKNISVNLGETIATASAQIPIPTTAVSPKVSVSPTGTLDKTSTNSGKLTPGL